MNDIVTIGTSLGGFNALVIVLGGIPKDFQVPIAVVQHRSIEESDVFAPLLAAYAALPVHEVNDKDVITAGNIYVGPPNYHLMIEGDHFALSTEGPVMYARPSIDVLFETAADNCKNGVIGVLLTGSSRDGSSGLAKIKKCGGVAVVQDPATAEGKLMPKAAIESVQVDKVLPLEEIAPFLVELCRVKEGDVLKDARG